MASGSCIGLRGSRRQGSQVSMRVARGSASWLSSHGRALRPHESQHARPPCPSPTPGVHLKMYQFPVFKCIHLCNHHNQDESIPVTSARCFEPPTAVHLHPCSLLQADTALCHYQLDMLFPDFCINGITVCTLLCGENGESKRRESSQASNLIP